jgi:peptidyl-prolyl cis-trans isomerase-like 4
MIQFFVTLADNLDYLDGKYAVFGEVVEEESFATLDKINNAFVDDSFRPFKDIRSVAFFAGCMVFSLCRRCRIRHTIILDDPFPDPPELIVPSASPVPSEEQLKARWCCWRLRLMITYAGVEQTVRIGDSEDENRMKGL